MAWRLVVIVPPRAIQNATEVLVAMHAGGAGALGGNGRARDVQSLLSACRGRGVAGAGAGTGARADEEALDTVSDVLGALASV